MTATQRLAPKISPNTTTLPITLDDIAPECDSGAREHPQCQNIAHWFIGVETHCTHVTPENFACDAHAAYWRRLQGTVLGCNVCMAAGRIVEVSAL